MTTELMELRAEVERLTRQRDEAFEAAAKTALDWRTTNCKCDDASNAAYCHWAIAAEIRQLKRPALSSSEGEK